MLFRSGPAGRAGVRAGDLLVALGGRSLTGVEDLHAALDGDDRTLELELLRGADERTLTIELEAA